MRDTMLRLGHDRRRRRERARPGVALGRRGGAPAARPAGRADRRSRSSAIVVFALGSVFTARRVTTPLRSLADAAERLGGGDYATPMTGMQRHDEIGELSQSFERMRHSIAANQAQIMKLAYWDTLTGLPNRAQFRDAVQRAIGQARPERRGGRRHARPESLQARQRRARLPHRRPAAGRGRRATDAPGDARRRRRRAPERRRVRGAAALRRRRARARRSPSGSRSRSTTPFVLEEQPVDIGAAVGVACWPLHADDGDALLNRAEVAMYAAKHRGNGAAAVRPVDRARQRPDADADDRAAPRGRRRRAAPVPAAEAGARDRPADRRRGAAALAASRARPGAAVALHPVRRADRLHPHADAVGARGSGAPLARAQRRGAAAAAVDQPVDARPARPGPAAEVRGAARAARASRRAPSASRSPRAR